MTNGKNTEKRSASLHMGSKITKAIVWIAGALTAFIFVFLAGYILVKGVPNLKPELFSPTYTTENVSMLPAIINTVTMTFLTLLFACPIGIFSAIYLSEYARRDNKFVKLVRLTTETLAGIPSIVYGLFGYLIFVKAIKLSYSILAGALTLAIMTLPTIMRTTEEALISVPDAYREGSFGLGAGKLRTIFLIILPSAMPGILSGIILSIGRIVGETAALIYTAGTVTGVAGLLSSGRTLSVHMYALISEGLYTDQAYATAVILLILVVLINALSGFVSKKLATRGKNEKV